MSGVEPSNQCLVPEINKAACRDIRGVVAIHTSSEMDAIVTCLLKSAVEELLCHNVVFILLVESGFGCQIRSSAESFGMLNSLTSEYSLNLWLMLSDVVCQTAID